MNAVALKLSIVILLGLTATRADVSHLGYRGYRGERLRLQRVESKTTPYPAAGYRPNREFQLPQDQPLFPLANQQSSTSFGSNSFNNLGEAQRPQLTYGSPLPEPRVRPQKFDNGNEPREQVFVVKYDKRYNTFERPQQPQNFNGDFDNNFNSFAGTQQSESDIQTAQYGFNDLSEPQQPSQQPNLLYVTPNNQEQEQQSARLRQQLIARLQQAQRLQQIQQQQAENQRYKQSQLQQQFFNAPQTLYSAPEQQTQSLAESQRSRLVLRKPARLTDNREETELETDVKTAEIDDIETTTKADEKQAKPQIATTVPASPNGVVTYFPAGAVSFVQPFNAAYAASANYQTLPSAAYTVASPFLSQPYALTAPNGAQLQAW